MYEGIVPIGGVSVGQGGRTCASTVELEDEAMKWNRGVIAIAMLAACVPTATATASGGIKVCVPSKEGKPITTQKAGMCKSGYAPAELGAEGKEGPEGKNALSGGEIETLHAVLPYIKYLAAGVAGKPTVVFSGVNVEVNSGAGRTDAAINGEGNLVIGYDEDAEGRREQSGSNNLILGEEQAFSSYGGIVAGLDDEIAGPFASIVGGENNTANSFAASVSGGDDNTASNGDASVSGGVANTASGPDTSVSGGRHNTASSFAASIGGGYEDIASGEYASIGGGLFNVTSGQFAWNGGGYGNLAEGESSSIFGGDKLKTTTTGEAIP